MNAKNDMALNTNQACKITGLSRSTLLRYEANGHFPVRFKIGPHRVAYSLREIQQWIKDSMKSGRVG